MDVSPASSEPDLSQQELKKLILEVGDLQRRVVNLEQRVGVAVPLSASAVTSVPTALPELRLSAEAVPTLGKALLGIAGAYLLRALTEIGALPQAAGVAAGIAYAALWLSLAGRTHAQRRLVITVYASTSMLILAPLLWEATFRLNVISSWTAAAVVTAFALIAQALSCGKKVTALFGIAAVSSALIAMVLMVAKHDLLPFTLAILMIAAGMEATAYYDHPARWLVAGMADLSILIFSVLVSLKGGLPEGYAPTSLRAALITQAMLLVIYVAGTAARTLVRDRSITSGEIAQTALAFLIGLGGALQTSKGDIRATFAVALFALAAGSACYVISSVFLGRERNRNFYVYATVAWLCVLAGSFPLFSGLALVAAWSAFALACCWAGLRAKQHVLGLHGAVLLLLTSLVSGVVPQSTAQLFGAGDASPWSPAGVVVVAAFLSYVVVAGISPGRVSALVISATLAWGVAGLAARGLVLAWQAFQGGHGKGFPTATFGTAALMFLTTAMAWSASTWRRPELIWLVYAFMTVAGCKLLMLDLRLTNTLPLVISLLLYGGTLMLLPRILQSGRTSKSTAAA